MVKKFNSETERKIKQAAKEIFLSKWLSWARTREITEKSWVNLALLNYYFWWKDELYNVIMIEILEDFKGTILRMLNNQETTFEEKLEDFANSYYDSIVANPKVFPFILNILEKDINSVKSNTITKEESVLNSYFAKQYIETTGKNIDDFKEFFINFLWLIAFPIIWAPLFTSLFEFNEQQYHDFLLRRKKLIKKIIPEIY